MEPDNNNNNGSEPKKHASVRQLLRQQRELQEKRKFGLAPLAVDTETHQEISPNIPEFISRAPWYYGASGPTLAHQRKQDGTASGKGEGGASDEILHDSVDRIVVKGQATRFVAGACRNCGSRTHKTHECFQAKKKVGSVYTNKVTGVDLETQQAAKTYAQKRDRFVGEVGVDLMRGVRQEGSDATTSAETGEGDTSRVSGGSAAKLHRPEGIFAARTPQHGGVEVKELPKYLHNLDQHDGLFFDPKTGSMRANPNVEDSTKTFQGDLERYRSGDYYNYVESQYRFLTGQSRSFVDFEFDETMRRARKAEEGGGVSADTSAEVAEAKPETAQDVLLRSLYGAGRPAPATETLTDATDGATDTKIDSVANTAPPEAPADAPAPSSSSPPLSRSAAATADAAPLAPAAGSSLIQAAALAWLPTRNGHAAVYGSYFDPVSFEWGYACCKATAKDAPGCSKK